MFQISQNCIDLVKEVEGVRLVPYSDSRGWATVGIGHLIRRGPVDVSIDKPITAEQAQEFFQKDAAWAAREVNSLVRSDMLNQNRFDALVSFVYNVGVGNFIHSSVLKFLNEGNVEDAGKAMAFWNKSGGRFVQGLANRRVKEMELFFKEN